MMNIFVTMPVMKPALLNSIAEKKGVSFLDAAEYAEPSKVDGVHLGVDGHRELGTAIADKIASLQV